MPLLLKAQREGDVPLWNLRQQAQLERLLSVGYGFAVSLEGRMEKLQALAHAFNKGDLSLAAIILVRMALPPLPSHDHAQRLAKAAGLRKYDGQPRLGGPPNRAWFASETQVAPKPDQKVKPPPLPDAVRDWFHEKGQMENWKKFNEALAKMPELTDQERQIYAQIFAWEGGMMSHGRSGAFAGVKPEIFEAAQADDKACKAIPGLDKVEKVSDLTPEQLAGVYRWYMDDIFQHVGKHEVLSQISDPKAAAALADTLFNLGAPDGSQLLIQAVNDVRSDLKQPKIATVSSSGKTINWVSPGLINAYKELASDEKTRALLLAKVAKLRNDDNVDDKSRHAYFQ